MVELNPALKRKLLEKRGIVGVSDPEDKIIVYVEDERKAKAVPRALDNIPVETVVVGKVRALPLLAQDVKMKVRPIVGGISIGPPIEIAGTLGIVMNGRILTCAHVAAMDYMNVEWFERGTKILQPSLIDGGKLEDDVIGYLSDYGRMSFGLGSANIGDAAIVHPVVDFKEMEVFKVGKLRGIVRPESGMNVKKIGRTTGLTESQILDTKATMKVDYGPFGFAIFKDCVIAKPAFAQGGDSGAPVFTDDGYLAGFVFAGSEYVTVIQTVESFIKSLEGSEIRMDMTPYLLLGGAFVIGSAIGYFLSKEVG